MKTQIKDINVVEVWEAIKHQEAVKYDCETGGMWAGEKLCTAEGREEVEHTLLSMDLNNVNGYLYGVLCKTLAWRSDLTWYEIIIVYTEDTLYAAKQLITSFKVLGSDKKNE